MIRYEIEGEDYGEGPTVLESHGGKIELPYSYAWCCPRCGRIWAKAICGEQQFFFINAACKEHYYHSLNVPGSVWPPFLQDRDVVLPPAVLRRELEIHINAVEKGVVG